jgi:hypothetical protein
MKFFFLFATLLVVPFVSASSGGLRSEIKKDLPRFHSHSSGKVKAGTMGITGTFPTTPVYGIIQEFDEGCGTPLTAVESFLTGVCFSDGTISQKYSCSK